MRVLVCGGDAIKEAPLIDLTAGPDLSLLPTRQQKRKAMRDWAKKDRRAMTGLGVREEAERSLYCRTPAVLE